MHTFIIAEHPEFGKIRTVEKDGKIWFCAKDVAASLGYANTRDAIDRHCKQKGVCVRCCWKSSHMTWITSLTSGGCLHSQESSILHFFSIIRHYFTCTYHWFSISLLSNQELDGNKYCHQALFLLSYRGNGFK